MQEKSVITRTVEAAGGLYAPGHLGELTQIVDFVLVDTVLEETGSREKRLRLLPSRVVVYFVLALALFEDCSCWGVWGKLTAGLEGLPLVRLAVSSLSRARRRIGAAPLRRLFEILAGPVAHLGRWSSPARRSVIPGCAGTVRRRRPRRPPLGWAGSAADGERPVDP
ncbi:transposase domain-containing protein [Streptomyces sp. NPDC056987]|uniref:transposase domain-containing protein n=1 Tax=Streptomyces sp. NPDC056987 TaxID=3345988 RepID=UPI00362FA80E